MSNVAKGTVTVRVSTELVEVDYGRASVDVADIPVAVAALLFELSNPFWCLSFATPSTCFGVVQVESCGSTQLVEIESSSGNIVIIHGSRVDDKTLALRILSSCRLIFKRIHARYGGVNVHASCIDRAGQGTLITGRPGAGKTTMALSSLGPLTTFVANDQCILTRVDGASSMKVSAFPALVAVRDMQVLSQLADVEPVRCSVSSNGAADGVRREFAIPDVVRVLGSRVNSSSQARLLVDYVQVENPGHLELDPLDSAEWLSLASMPLESSYSAADLSGVDDFLSGQLDLSAVVAGPEPEGVPAYRLLAGRGQTQRAREMIRELAEPIAD